MNRKDSRGERLSGLFTKKNGLALEAGDQGIAECG